MIQNSQLQRRPVDRTIIIGAGIGGLATALRLCAAGESVHVIERASAVGGKMRTIPTDAGPVDAGPTVLTMRSVFDDLFAQAGTRLEDHLTLNRQHILARHWWADGSSLDLTACPAENRTAIHRLSGARDAKAFTRFCDETRALFTAFEAPMMLAAEPNQAALALRVAQNPRLLLAMRPHQSLAASLARYFRDPRLRQLFGRYATYVGGSPYESPALLALIWHAEASGVWTVEGGMHQLAHALAEQIERLGGTISLNTSVARLNRSGHRVSSVTLDTGDEIRARSVVFNGDPRALAKGHLGPDAPFAPNTFDHRSLSAYVWSFSAHTKGLPLVHHNVFFANNPNSEFGPIRVGEMAKDATLYLCAQDRDDSARAPDGQERFEIIMNAAPSMGALPKEEFERCRTQTFTRLAQMGLTVYPTPGQNALTTPSMFNQLFPGSAGSLYGQSPHGLMAAMKRPRARTELSNLYLAGGGAHPGAGVPMAALSGKHAAEAILSDLASTSTSRRTDMPGGISTVSAMMDSAQSRSSAS